MKEKTFVFLIALLVFVGVTGLLFLHSRFDQTFKSLSGEAYHQSVIERRDYGIQLAIENGDYQCCITPPCTMCYMEANKWNYQTPATCACDQLIAQGKEPCPQCQDQVCGFETEGACKQK